MTAPTVTAPNPGVYTLEDVHPGCDWVDPRSPVCPACAEWIIRVSWECDGVERVGHYLFCTVHKEAFLQQPQCWHDLHPAIHPCRILMVGRL